MATTVLLGWELGGGLGHVKPLLLLARALEGEGFAPVLAVNNLTEPGSLLRDAPYPVLQAPLFPRELAAPGFRAGSYADILALKGFAEPEGLSAMVRGWQGLLDMVRPALVIADHAPTLSLATFGVIPDGRGGQRVHRPSRVGGGVPALGAGSAGGVAAGAPFRSGLRSPEASGSSRARESAEVDRRRRTVRADVVRTRPVSGGSRVRAGRSA